MPHPQGLDLGNVLQQVETIRGQRAGTALQQQTLQSNVLAQQGSNQFNVLLQQHLANPTPQTLNAIAAVDPNTAIHLQTVQTGQQEQEQRNAQIAVAGATNLIKSADPKRFLDIALPELKEQLIKNGVDVDNLSNEEVVTIGNEIIARQTSVATTGQEPALPLSPAGKERFDIRRGFLTEEQVAADDEAVTFSSVTQNPDGSTTGISSKTGQLEIIPSSVEGVQNIKQVDAINKLITEAKKDKRVDNFITVSSNFDRVDSASPNAAGDLALVFSFMKMLDPGSVVREGEQALARNAAGVPERIRTTYNNILAGDSLSPTQRKEFKAEAGKVFLASRKTAQKAVAPIVNQAKRLNLRSETIEEVVFGLPEEAPQIIQFGDLPQ